MQLRANVRPPGRYREDSVEDLPPNPRFVVPTTPFNSNLRPAVFPTLRWDELAFDHPISIAQRDREEQAQREKNLREREEQGRVEVSEERSESAERPETSERLQRLQRPQRPAIVFRDMRTVPIMEQEDGLVQGPDGRWISTLEPGEFDPYAVNFDDDDEHEQRERDERWFLPVLREQKYWDDLSNGMKLIIIRELTNHLSFEDTVLSFLQLGEQELEEFLNLCADEIKIRALEKETVARIQARQMELLDRGEWSVEGDEYLRIYDEEMARAGDRMPATWLISREDVAIAKNFLGNYRFKEEFEDVPDVDIEELNRIPTFAVLSEIQDRLELYIGVATKFEDLDFGEDFLEYLPLDVLVMEEFEDGEVVRAAEFPLVPAPTIAERASGSFNQPQMGTFKTSTPNPSPGLNAPKEKATTKSPTKKDIERDGINNELLKRRGRGRPRKKDKIVNGPSRLREVTNAEDLQTPRQSPTIGDDANPGPVTDGTPARLVTTPPRSIQNLARSPFKEYSSASPPPKHSASFPTSLPTQPAPTSPPKGSSRLNDSVDAADESAASGPSTMSNPNIREARKDSDRPSKNTRIPNVQESLNDFGLLRKDISIPNVQESMKDSDLSGKDGRSAAAIQPPITSTPNVQKSMKNSDLPSKDNRPPTRSLAVPKPSISSSQRSVAELAKSQSDRASPPNTHASFFGTDPITPSAAHSQTPTPSNAVQQVGQPAASKVSAHKSKTSQGSPQSNIESTPTKINFNVKGAQESSPNNSSTPSAAAPAKRDRDEANSSLAKESPAKKPRLEQPDQVQQGVVNSIIGGAKSIGKKLMNPFKGSGEGLAKLGDPSRSGMVNNSDAAAKVGGMTRRSEKVNDSDVQRETQFRTPAPAAAKFDNANRTGPVNDLDIPAGAFVSDPSKTTVEVQIPAPKRAASEISAGTFEREGSPAKKSKQTPAMKKPAAQPKKAQPKPAPQPKAARATKDTKATIGKDTKAVNGKAAKAAK